MMTFEELRELHAMATTHREKASLEVELWQRFGAQDPSRTWPGRREYLSEILRLTPAEVERRHTLIGLGDAANPLWDRLERDLTLSAVTEIIRRSRAISRERVGVPMAVTVAAVLDEYDSRPFVRDLGGGKLGRSGQPTRPVGGRTGPIRRTSRAPAPSRASTEAIDKKSRGSQASAEHVFRVKMREIVREYVDDMLAGHAEANVIGEAERVEAEIRVVLAEFLGRITRKKKNPTLAEVITRSKLAGACQILHVDPPKSDDYRGGRWYGRTKKLFKELAASFHEDRVGSGSRDQFLAVMEAWRVVEAFMDQKETTRVSAG
jgi:hypothetical protein